MSSNFIKINRNELIKLIEPKNISFNDDYSDEIIFMENENIYLYNGELLF